MLHLHCYGLYIVVRNWYVRIIRIFGDDVILCTKLMVRYILHIGHNVYSEAIDSIYIVLLIT